MESHKLDIIELIELNPITRLSKEYTSKLIKKIQENFTEAQQHVFLASFFCYLKYNSKIDFVIDLNDIWKWLEFSRKEHCKVVLTKHFKIETDYKIFLIKATEVAGASKVRGCAGLNKEKILMTINTFKKLCLKAGTKKADEMHDYFIKMEETFQEVLDEENNELKNQLQQQKTQFIKDKQQILLDSYHKKCIVYLIKIIVNGIILYKFGYTDDIKRRISEHLREISKDIELVYCIESKNNTLLENELKKYLKNTNFKKEQIINNNNQTELIDIEDISVIQDELKRINKCIYEDKEYMIIKRLELENEILRMSINKQEVQENVQEKKVQEKKVQEKKVEKSVQEPQEKKVEKSVQEPQENDQEIVVDEKLRLKRENACKRVAKYRKSEKYQQYLQSDEYKEKEKLRSQKRSQTEEFKKYKSEYYKNNKERIDNAKTIWRSKRLKSTLLKTDEEKNKFIEWLNLNIKHEKDKNIPWKDLLYKYLERNTSPTLSTLYKEYFIEYYQELYSNVKVKYLQYIQDNKSYNGFRQFTFI